MAVNVGELLFKIGADIATFKADMGKVESEFSKAMKKMDNASTKLGQSLAFVFSAAGFIAFTRQVRSLAAAGAELEDVSAAFIKLGGSMRSIEEASEATQGAVTNLELLRAATKGLTLQIPDLNKNFSLIADVATKIAKTTGEDAAGAIERLTGAIGKMSAKTLKEFGVVIKAGDEVSDVFARLEEVQSRLPKATRDVDAAFVSLFNTLSDSKGEIGKIINNLEPLGEALGWLEKRVKDLTLGFRYLFSADDIAKLARLAKSIENLEAQMDWADKSSFAGFLFGIDPAQTREQLARLKAEFVGLQAHVKGQMEAALGDKSSLGAQFSNQIKKGAEAIKEIPKETEPVLEEVALQLEEVFDTGAEEAARAYEETFQSLATTFADLMSEALETGTIDFERIMQRIAIDFASTVAAGLAASVLGNLPGGSIGQVIGGGVLQGLGINVPGGGDISSGLIGGLIGGGGAGALIGSAPITMSAASAAGMAGPPMASGLFASGSGALGMLGAMGPWGWAALGALAIGGGLFAGGVFGGGGMSAGQRERANIREQIAQQAGNEGLFSTPWGMRDLFDIDFADFKPGASAIGDAAFGQMSGLAAILTGGGEQMDEFQSILAQMATGWSDSATQAENLNQVLIAQMSLMSQMGISAEEAKQSLLDLFFQGKISLEEFAAGVEQMNLIATENLVGEGSIADALGLLADTINTDPRSALHALMLAFKEAAEVSDDQLGAVREVFIQMFGPEAAAILDAFAQMGIDTWEELANASVDQIVFIFGQLQQIATDTVEAVSDAAQSTSETIGRGVTLNVDARGAGPGVGEEVRAAVMSMRGEIEQISAHATSQMLARQANFGGAL